MEKNRKRRGRPKSGYSNYVRVQVSLPFNLLSILDQEREKRGYTRSEVIRQAMRQILEVWTGRRM